MKRYLALILLVVLSLAGGGCAWLHDEEDVDEYAGPHSEGSGGDY